MAYDAYVSSTDKNGTKTTHVNSSGAITAPMGYAVWDKTSQSARVICVDPATAETELRTLLTKRGPTQRAELAVITVPL